MALSRFRNPRYLLRLLAITVGVIVIVVIGLPIGAGAAQMWSLTHPSCNGDQRTPADKGIGNYKAIGIPSKTGKTYRAFFMPGTRDATIIIPPTYNGARISMIDEGSLLAGDGYNVLMFESRVCAGLPAISLGYSEVDDVGDALDYLRNNTDNIHVNMSRIALHGFSSAGATAIMAGARYPEIAGVLAEGNYHNMDAYLGVSGDRNTLETLIVFGAKVAYRVGTGIDSSALDPLGAAAKIPPRPLYLIHGTTEPSFVGGHLEYAAALSAVPAGSPANVHLWEVPGAWHGGYLTVAGVDVYKQHVLPFFACTLTQDCTAWTALWASATH
jgi:hypothetical protein